MEQHEVQLIGVSQSPRLIEAPSQCLLPQSPPGKISLKPRTYNETFLPETNTLHFCSHFIGHSRSMSEPNSSMWSGGGEGSEEMQFSDLSRRRKAIIEVDPFLRNREESNLS